MGFQRQADDLVLGKSRKGGPLDKILHVADQEPKSELSRSIHEQTEGPDVDPDQNNEEVGGQMFASDEDIPAEYRGRNAPKIALSEAVKSRVGGDGDLNARGTVMMDGVEMDATLLDIVQTARADLSGAQKEISGKQVLVIMRCVQDTKSMVPSREEENVLRFMLKECRLTSEAKQLLNRHLRKVAGGGGGAGGAGRAGAGAGGKAGRGEGGRKESARETLEDEEEEEEEEEEEGRRRGGREEEKERRRGGVGGVRKRGGAEWLSELETAINGQDAVQIVEVVSAMEAANIGCDDVPRELVLVMRKLRKASDIKVKAAARGLFEQWRAQANRSLKQ